MNEHKKQLVKNFNEIAKQKQKVKKKILWHVMSVMFKQSYLLRVCL